MHLNKDKSIKQCLSDRLDYGKNPDKTENGTLVTCYACDQDTADADFALSKWEYFQLTGRKQDSDVIAYQVRQSFKSGEITPEEANRIGYEFAKRFLKGNHAFIVCTHADKHHIHNHIYWNSTMLDCTRKFRDFWGSTLAVRRLSDLICVQHRMSVIENLQPHGMSYNRWQGDIEKLSNRDRLCFDIDEALVKKPHDFDVFLSLMEQAGYTITRGKNITFSHPRYPRQEYHVQPPAIEAKYPYTLPAGGIPRRRNHCCFVRQEDPQSAQAPQSTDTAESPACQQSGGKAKSGMRALLRSVHSEPDHQAAGQGTSVLSAAWVLQY